MYLRVIVTPEARKESVTEGKKDELHISVREPAAQNRANLRVRELVALHYHKPLTEVRILHGHHSRSKLISVRDSGED